MIFNTGLDNDFDDDTLSLNFLKSKTNDFKDVTEIYSNRVNYNLLDTMTGRVTESVYGIPVVNGGSPPKLETIIGSSGVGKTALVLGNVCSMVHGIKNAFVYFFDEEGNTPRDRLIGLTQWSPMYLNKKLRYFGEGNALINIYNLILEIVDMKKKNAKHLKVNSHFPNIHGTPIALYPPTPIVVDSIAAVSSKGTEKLEYDRGGDLKAKEALYSNIDGMTEARAIKNFIDKVKPFTTEFNIPLMFINHMTKEAAMGMFDRPDKKHPNLKAGFKMKGGDEITFQSFLMRELLGKKEINEFNPAYGPAVHGTEVQVKFIKNKANTSGLPYKMIFDYNTGYRPELSDFEFLAEIKYGFHGSPLAYRLDIFPEVSFTRKTLWELCKNNQMFARALSLTAFTAMVYKIILREDLPDLKIITEKMDEEVRYAYILSHSTDYPFYRYEQMAFDDIVKIDKGSKFIGHVNHRSHSFITKDDYHDICEDGNEYGIGSETEYYVTDIVNCDSDGYLIEKES